MKFHNPNWRIHIFQRGRAQPPTSYGFLGETKIHSPAMILSGCLEEDLLGVLKLQEKPQVKRSEIRNGKHGQAYGES